MVTVERLQLRGVLLRQLARNAHNSRWRGCSPIYGAISANSRWSTLLETLQALGEQKQDRKTLFLLF